MGMISAYANVLKSKLTDLFVVYQRNNGELETKNATLEQLGDAICGEQVHSDLKTDNQTIIGSINELAKDKNVADEYDDTHTYNKGDVTIYDNTLYICNTNNTTGTFDPSKWTATTIDNVIGDLTALTTSNKSSLVGAVNEVNAKESYKVRVSQLLLPNTITLPANTATKVLDNSDVKSLAYSALDNISNITGTLVGVMFMWCSGGGAICLDSLVWEGKCTMYLMSTYTKDISAIRLMTIWKQ